MGKSTLVISCGVCLALLTMIAKPAFAGPGENNTSTQPSKGLIRPGNPEWPTAWISYKKVASLEEDWADLKAHGVGLISRDAKTVEDARAALEAARRLGMKFHISIGEITENAPMVQSAGLEPVDALMIGGVYQGKALDRHLFTFKPGKNTIVIEPPVYNKAYAYVLGTKSTGSGGAGEKFGHYFPEMPAPVKAEIIVPLKPFDGRQHLKIIPATVTEAPKDARLEVDSVTPDLPETSETKNRKLYQLSFDLTGLDDAMLDQVGIAVYWPYRGSNQLWMFGHGLVTAWADSTQKALRVAVRKTLAPWIEANGGTFPTDVVIAARFGDECFYVTGHLADSMVNYPLWEYSQPSIDAFHKHAGQIEYPRTWGFPEIYGVDAYAWWMYTLHEGCADLCGIVHDEIAQAAPGLLLFRNTTRAGVFDIRNDHDGSGQELLTRNLDIVHLDPYPVTSRGYIQEIPRDMSYLAGLARRYDRLLIPWMQAHVYPATGLVEVAPQDIDRMAAEQLVHGPDAVIWLGYGDTFPNARPDSWQHAGEFHKKLAASQPAKSKADLAVLRPYRTWAVSHQWQGKIRNPADWMLQQFLEVWAVQRGQPYDVFEISPSPTAAEQKALEKSLKHYKYVVSTEPREGVWVIGEGTLGKVVDPATAADVRKQFEAEMTKRGWLK